MQVKGARLETTFQKNDLEVSNLSAWMSAIFHISQLRGKGKNIKEVKTLKTE